MTLSPLALDGMIFKAMRPREICLRLEQRA